MQQVVFFTCSDRHQVVKADSDMKQSLGPAQQAAADQAIAEIANDEISTEEMDNANADNPDCRDWCASLLAKFGDGFR